MTANWLPTDTSLPADLAPAVPDLPRAVLATLAYADLFDHPLTAAEAHRHLVAAHATLADVTEALDRSPRLVRRTTRWGEFFTLVGREAIVEVRLRRETSAAALWPRARRWGRVFGALPFVRMVAVTGALAVDAVEPDADIDYLVVASTGRVWLCRALVTALARAAGAAGTRLCPNYVLSERALALAERTLYTAHELLQMVPIAGPETCERMREANPWVRIFLPNSPGVAPPSVTPRRVGGALARLAEAALRGRVGDRIEAALARWQASHLQGKLARGELSGGEAAFDADGYKGHFHGHGARILAAWETRLRQLDGAWA
ncbi:MAG: hypothetical protein A2Y78_14930 [Acidobacteria bacterium RBG_13_68_16]|nr:MAG: hypothetical protein A2Y78_14930 [Acidobacteria bacterium RBG_13_68_16]